MDNKLLIKKARLSTGTHVDTLNRFTLHKLELAYIAEWIYMQDDNTDAKAILTTAKSAINELINIYNREEE